MNELTKRTITGVTAGIVFFGAYFASPNLFSSLLLVILAIILIFEWPKVCRTRQCLFTSIIYPIFPIMILVYFTYNYYSLNKFIPLYPFIISWIHDSGAYVTGMLFGKHKICPLISPKKSWEGLIGAFSFVLLTNYIIIQYNTALSLFLLSQNIALLLLQSTLVTLAAFTGDIFVSYLKRKVHLKDTGTLLPGHGGLLDRFDSVLFVAILLFLFSLFH